MYPLLLLIGCFAFLLGICYAINRKIEKLYKKIEEVEAEIEENLTHKIFKDEKPTKPINTKGMSCSSFLQ